eukprot:scaffold2605_cov356-Ochromonas_danica.AAC.1
MDIVHYLAEQTEINNGAITVLYTSKEHRSKSKNKASREIHKQYIRSLEWALLHLAEEKGLVTQRFYRVIRDVSQQKAICTKEDSGLYVITWINGICNGIPNSELPRIDMKYHLERRELETTFE